jgi:N-acetylmuramoyl-L-alanine amidase
MKLIIGFGHGGTAFGHYLTPGKRSPEVPPGIYEGEFLREVGKRIMDHPDVLILNPGPIDIPLGVKVKAINQICKQYPDCVYIELHTNAAGKPGWSNANGTRVFYYEGKWRASIKGKYLASYISNLMPINTLGNWARVFGKNFYMLRKPKCPAALVELDFHTHPEIAPFMASEQGVEFYSRAINMMIPKLLEFRL